MNFVIIYHRPTGLMGFDEVEDSQEAVSLRSALEDLRPDTDWEIVVLHAKDLATIQQTHSRYFMGDWKRMEPAA